MTRVLILPNSLGTDRTLWDAQVAPFCRAFRVVRIQLGAGRTIAELARDALTQLDDDGVERPSWCGVSLGGMVGMWIAANVPERLDRLVLACTAARMPSPEVYKERAALVRERGIEPFADSVVARWFTRSAPPELSQRFRATLVATDTETYARGCEAVGAWDFRGDLERVAAPTLVLAGAEDEATPSEATDLLASEIPGARHGVIDGAAHLANVERPAEFSAAALAHLEAA